MFILQYAFTNSFIRFIMKKVFLLLFVLVSNIVAAQYKDTITISLQEAEKMFLEKNYFLLAQKYNIDAADASIRQAKLWYNPTFFFESNFYNPHTGKVFNYGPVGNGPTYNNGQFQAQISQIIRLAGKRSKLVRLAEINKNLEQLAFEDLMRVLRLEIYGTYTDLYASLKKQELFLNEMQNLASLVEITKIQLNNGATSGYELTRLQYELQNIEASLNEANNMVTDNEANLKLLIGLDPTIFVIPDSIPVSSNAPLPILQTSFDSAMTRRPDRSISEMQLKYNESSLRLERASAVPNLMVGATYDRFGNAYTSYTGLNVTMDLPFFNRNQGNIKKAEVMIESSKADLSYNELQIKQEVVSAYKKVADINDLRSKVPGSYNTSLQNISKEAAKSYNRQLISLLDYLDKIRTYKNAQLNLIDMEKNYFQSRQYFNYVTNSKFF
jgi:cobalt-zinc-cadmium efflux system outer membrane protein